ncbi:hypothetical protein GC197_06940 [bacterium]|nr:hypothetical protein [bacterium]
MQFRRNGLRDERRRRALMDDRSSDSGNRSETDTTSDSVCRSARTYSRTAVEERRIRVVDLVPVYVIQVIPIYVGLLLAVGILLALDHYAANILRWADLSRVDSLGTFFSAASLMFGAVIAVLVYRIRRHRLDDYRGRYRCWLWFAALLLFASLDSVLNFRTDVARGLEAVTRVRLLGQIDGWWCVVWTLAYGSMALRALIEIRESRGTVVVSLFSGLLIFLGMTLQLDLLLVPGSVPTSLAVHAAQLGGISLLLAALVQYVRFVWLDAQGLITRRTRVAAPRKSEPAEKLQAKRPHRAAKAAAEDDSFDEEAETEPKRSWFSLFGKRSDQPGTESAEEESKPARQTAKKVEEEPEEAKPKRGWFSWGKKDVDDQEQESEPAKPKIAAETKPEEDADEPVKRKSWFSWGSKKQADDENDASNSSSPGDEQSEKRTTMNPRVKTRPKTQPNQAPTITGKYNQSSDAAAESSDDQEILRLESKPDHLLSKAERRRLKKLKRRTAA